MRKIACLFSLLPVLLAGTVSLSAQSWRLQDGAGPVGRSRPLVAFDEARGEVVMIGGGAFYDFARGVDATWTWDGAWTQHPHVGPAPTESNLGSIAYDAVRQRTVLVGGRGPLNELTDETWEWDGVRWTQVFPSQSPPDGGNRSMVFDSVQGVCVLITSSTALGSEVWTFDGVDWLNISATSGPQFRVSRAGFAFDAARNRVVAAGGFSLDFFGFAGTWEWDGLEWENVSAVEAPTGIEQTLAYDSLLQRTVALARTEQGGFSSDTYVWDGATWALAGLPPVRRIEHALVYDSARQGVLAIGGAQMPGDDTATLGTSPLDSGVLQQAIAGWVAVELEVGLPAFGAAAYRANTDETVYFGGRRGFVGPAANETFLRRQGVWVEEDMSVRPAGRSDTRLVDDRRRGELVMFGGAGEDGPMDDTWVFDGQWHQRFPQTSPSRRSNMGLVYDLARERVVLFGGFAPLFSFPSDTWEWDGSDWTLTVPESAGPEGFTVGFVMAYDAKRQRTVLTQSGMDTLEYDGQGWTTVGGPSPLSQSLTAGAYDPVREMVVVCSQDGQSAGWDGTQWTMLPGLSTSVNSMVFHEREARLVAFVDGSQSWELRTDTPPSFEVFDASSCGDAALTTRPLSYPVLGRDFELAVGGSDAFGETFLLLGGTTTVGGMPLPVALDGIGAPGCDLLQSAGVWFGAMADGQGTASFSLSIPSGPAFLGVDIAAQGVTSEAGLNALGLGFSAGVLITIGN